MKIRNLDNLASLDFTKQFCEKYNLSVKAFEGQLLFFNKCIVIHCYGYYTESILYFDFYSRDLRHYTDADRLLTDIGIDDQSIIDIYNFYKENHKNHITELLHPNNLENTITAEQHYFTYIASFDKYLREILLCEYVNINEMMRKSEGSRIDSLKNIISKN